MIGHRPNGSDDEPATIGTFPQFRTQARPENPGTLLTEVQGLRGEVSEGLTAIRETLAAMLLELKREKEKP